MSDAYVPGTCNIGPAEVARRRDTGIAGTAIAAGVVAAAVGFGAPKPVRLLAALPATIGASGLLQARARFCSGFGLRGLANLGALGEQVDVEAAEDRAADRAKALRILGGAAAIGGGAAALTLLLP